MDSAAAELLFRIGKRRAVRGRTGQGIAEAASQQDYDQWRETRLETRFIEFFDPKLIAGKDVLDFACGSGALALFMARSGARKVGGIDLNANGIETARYLARTQGVAADFRLASTTARIDFDDRSWDIVVCWSALEHIMEYESVIPEWKRILRPGGKVLIRWGPYFHPYGHHADVYCPIPWLHVFVSDRVINMVCSKMVNLPEFNPPFWDLDANGNRIDHFAGSDTIGHLNHLTIARFERFFREAGFRHARREFQTFTTLRRFPLAEKLLTLPGLREFFTSSAVYELVAP
ncbi:MAG: class I SAM-dependent methyltransferase [Stellaceae bacterium]